MRDHCVKIAYGRSPPTDGNVTCNGGMQCVCVWEGGVLSDSRKAQKLMRADIAVDSLCHRPHRCTDRLKWSTAHRESTLFYVVSVYFMERPDSKCVFMVTFHVTNGGGGAVGFLFLGRTSSDFSHSEC